MYNEEINNLIHSGKKGMRWGVRNSKTSSDFKAVKPLRKKPASTLSNDEIKKVVTRLQLEKSYRDINPRGARKVTSGLSAGHKAVISILAVGATVNAAIAFSKTPVGIKIRDNIVNQVSKIGN